MKQDTLENIQIKPIIMNAHRVELRRALLTSSHWNKKQTQRFLFWKGGEEIMQKRRFAAMTFSALIIVFVTAFVLMPKNTETAYAEQVARESFRAVTDLSPEQLKALKERVKQDSKEILEEAKSAKDLKYFTYDEYVKSHPEFAEMPPPPISEGEERPDIKQAQFLEFTDKDGAITSIAIDPNSDLPFFITKKLFKSDGEEKGKFKNAVFRTHKAGEPGLPKTQGAAGFGISTEDGQSDILFQINDDGKTPVLTLNGKKYKLPEGFEMDPGTPPKIKVEGNDVFINGVKATPIE